MKHARLTDGLRERAALYALGSLAPEEARAFEDHVHGCGPCRAEAEALGAVAADLLLVPDPVAPRAALRDRLRAVAVSPTAEPSSDFRFVLQGDGEWTLLAPGVLRKDLAAAVAGSRSYLVRMERGARFQPHRHEAVEHCYVIEGDLHVAGAHIRAGDYHRAARGSTHAETASDGGCLLLIVESPA